MHDEMKLVNLCQMKRTDSAREEISGCEIGYRALLAYVRQLHGYGNWEEEEEEQELVVGEKEACRQIDTGNT
jgi:hypothetical protein